MSIAAVEARVIPKDLKVGSTAPDKQFSSVLQPTPDTLKRDSYFNQLPGMFLIQQDLRRGIGSEIPFVTQTAESTNLLVARGGRFVAESNKEVLNYVKSTAVKAGLKATDAILDIIPTPILRYGRYSPLVGFGTTMALFVACASPEAPVSPVAAANPEPNIPEATATLAPGAGGVKPEERNAVTKAIETQKAAEKESLSGILSPEAEATGVYVQWKLPSGRMATGMAFTLKKDEPIKIPKALQVAGSENAAYNGYGVSAVTDGQRYGFLGDIIPAKEKKEGDDEESPIIGNVGKDLKAGTIVGTIAGSGKTVFADAEFNFLVLYPTDEELKNTFKEQGAKLPRTVNLWDPNAKPTAGNTFFGVKPPIQQGG